jgi:predicted DCC family thiol-disulfide oxidoreductase YuxK
MSAIVFFDGVCNFCNASVNFIIDRDPAGYFQFAPLQSDVAKTLLAERGVAVAEGDPESMVLLEGDRVYLRSTAALRIARRLRGPWPLAYGFAALPAFARDAVYRLVAKERYRLFGRAEACRVPTPELRARFLAQS